jgi:hypothetical protein
MLKPPRWWCHVSTVTSTANKSTPVHPTPAAKRIPTDMTRARARARAHSNDSPAWTCIVLSDHSLVVRVHTYIHTYTRVNKSAPEWSSQAALVALVALVVRVLLGSEAKLRRVRPLLALHLPFVSSCARARARKVLLVGGGDTARGGARRRGGRVLIQKAGEYT